MSSTASIAKRSFFVSRTIESGFSPCRPLWTSGSNAGRAEPALLPAAGGSKLFDDREMRPRDAGEDELRDAVAWADHEVVGPRRIAVPRRDEAGPLVIGVDHADGVAEHQARAVAEPGARQHQRAQFGIANPEGN